MKINLQHTGAVYPTHTLSKHIDEQKCFLKWEGTVERAAFINKLTRPRRINMTYNMTSQKN